MASEIEAWLQQLPPGSDVFESVQLYLDNQVYPSMGLAFWLQAYVVLTILCISGVVFLVGLAIRARKGRLNFIVRDGCCSRIDLKFAVPVLWTIAVALQVAFSISFKRCLENREYTHFMGAVWFLVYAAPAVSYALLSATVAASAPPVRRYLSRVSGGVLWYNGAVAAVMCAVLIGTIVPALRHARSMQGVSKAHNVMSEAIQDARLRQDVAGLWAVAGLLPELDKADLEYRAAVRVANGLCCGFLAFYMITGALPALLLGRMVNRKIAQLQNERTSTIHTYEASDHGLETVNLPTLSTNDTATAGNSSTTIAKFPEQPRDRPFAQLIEMRTTIFPHRFHTILQAEDQTAKQRAELLRSVMAADLRMLVLYFTALFTFFVGCLFLACNGLDLLGTRGDLTFGYAYFTWNFAVTASGLAGLLFWDALRDPHSASSSPYAQHHTHHQQPRQSTSHVAPSVSAIHCVQEVDVAYVRDRDTDSPLYEKKQFYASRSRDI